MSAERGPRRRGAGGLLLLLLVTVLAGCVRVPTSGPVVQEDVPAGGGQGPFVSVLAEAPRPGDDEVGIVEGFLAALASYEPGLATARLYLTPEAASSWRPAGVDVHAGTEVPLRVVEPARVSGSVALSARLDEVGTWSAATGETLGLDVALERVDGEWRIATPPQRLVVSSFDFDREYQPYELYFLDPGFEVVVPDTVFLPVRASVSTLLVQALLRGPSPWLAPAVRTAFPAATELGIASVPVDAGTARVELTEPAAGTGPPERERMAAQLVWTLRQVPSVQRVAITVDTVPLVLPGSQSGSQPIDAYPGYDPVGQVGSVVYAVDGGRVVTVLGAGTEPVGGPLGVADVAYRSVGVAPGARLAAAVDDTGTRVDVAGFGDGEERTTVLEGADLSAPSLDRTGLVWVPDRGRAAVRAVDAAGTDYGVAVEAPAGTTVLQLRIAPDGARAVLVLRYADGRSAVAVALVLRDPPDGGAEAPLRLAGLQEVPLGGGEPLDAAWSSTARLAVLLRPGSGDPEPYLVGLRGSDPEGRGSVAGAITLAAAPGQPLVVGSAEGRLLRQDSVALWTPAGAGRAPAYPG